MAATSTTAVPLTSLHPRLPQHPPAAAVAYTDPAVAAAVSASARAFAAPPMVGRVGAVVDVPLAPVGTPAVGMLRHTVEIDPAMPATDGAAAAGARVLLVPRDPPPPAAAAAAPAHQPIHFGMRCTGGVVRGHHIAGDLEKRTREGLERVKAYVISQNPNIPVTAEISIDFETMICTVHGIKIALHEDVPGIRELKGILREKKFNVDAYAVFPEGCKGNARGAIPLVKATPLLQGLNPPIAERGGYFDHVWNECIMFHQDLKSRDRIFQNRMLDVRGRLREIGVFHQKLSDNVAMQLRQLEAEDAVCTAPTSPAAQKRKKAIVDLRKAQHKLQNIDRFAVGWAIAHEGDPDSYQMLQLYLLERKEVAERKRLMRELTPSEKNKLRLTPEEEQYCKDVAAMQDKDRVRNVEYFLKHQDALEDALLVRGAGDARMMGVKRLLRDVDPIVRDEILAVAMPPALAPDVHPIAAATPVAAV